MNPTVPNALEHEEMTPFKNRVPVKTTKKKTPVNNEMHGYLSVFGMWHLFVDLEGYFDIVNC